MHKDMHKGRPAQLPRVRTVRTGRRLVRRVRPWHHNVA